MPGPAVPTRRAEAAASPVPTGQPAGHRGRGGALATSRRSADAQDVVDGRDDHAGRPVDGLRDPYLLKDRVFDIDDFLDALRRVADGGTALDPEVVTRLIAARRDNPLTSLTARESEVLALMAEGHTNISIARRLWLTERTVETHVTSIMTKLGLATSDEHNRRVLAVVTYLKNRDPVV